MIRNLRAQPQALEKAGEKLLSSSGLASGARALPLPCLALVLGGFFFYRPTWITDPFILTILGFFAFTQAMAQVHFLRIHRRLKNSLAAVMAAADGAGIPNVEGGRVKLASVAPSYLKEVLQGWLDSAARGECEGNRTVLQNAARRRNYADQKDLRFHATMNRMTLKLGFIGTLIGLVITFPPMKRAILSLQDFQGEMGFVHDIVKAIEGDEYAIFSTLVATGLSFVIELVVIQVLARLYGDLTVVESHLDDWNSTVLTPWVRGQAAPKAVDVQDLHRLKQEMDRNLHQLHDAMKTGLETFIQASRSALQEMELLTQMQKSLGQGVRDLQSYEKERHLQLLGEMEADLNRRIRDLKETQRHFDAPPSKAAAEKRSGPA